MENRPQRLSEGLVVAAAPAYGYLLAYLYRRGFADELGIPVEFINVEVRDVLFTIVGALMIAAFLLPVVDLVLTAALALPDDRRWRVTFVYGVGWLTVVATQLAIYRNHLERVWPLAAGAAVVLVVSLLSTWANPPTSPPPSRGIVRIARGRGSVVIVLALLLAAVNTHALGAARALDQREFLVSLSTDEVVLAIYGATAVVAPHTERQLQDRFRLVELQGLDLQRQRIGPLRHPEAD